MQEIQLNSPHLTLTLVLTSSLTNTSSQTQPDLTKDNLPTKLRHNFVLNPITALAFYHYHPSPNSSPDSVFVLAAEDTWLKIYDVATSRLVSQLKVFYSQPIHGLHVSQSPSPAASSSTSSSATGEECERKDEPRLLVWGANSVAVLPQSTINKLVRGESDVEEVKEFKAADWIYDGILFPSRSAKNGETEVKGALVTAHNEVVPLSIGHKSSSSQITFGQLTSPSRPILYSANLCLLDDQTILVAGGTVFGEIVVWKYFLSAEEGKTKRFEVLYVFTGHEGSIFGVSISPEISLPGGEKIRLLASCSDDRTVRVWDITDSPKQTRGAINNGGEENGHPKAMEEARETGFGGTNNSEVKLENQNDKARCLAVAMGHVSRIWQVRFTGRTQHGDGNPIEVHSFGEDATRQRWDLSLDQKKWKEALERGYSGGGEQDVAGSFGTLKNCGIVSCHNGKNMWSTAVSGGDGLPTLIATGGADGKITMAGDQAVVEGAEGYEDIDVTLTVEDVMKVAEGVEEEATTPVEGQKKKSTTKNGFQRYAFLSENTLLATTSTGRLLHGTVGEGLTWKNVHLSETVLADLKSYYVVKSPVQGTAILGSSSGKVYLFLEDGHEIKELHTFPGKISDILLIEGSQETLHKDQPGAWTVIITVLGLDHALLMSFDPSTSSVTINPRKIYLSSDDVSPFIATAAAFCSSKLILGSRVGAVALYKSTDDAYTLDYSRKDARTKDAVTCIVPLPGSSTSFLTGCRDGRYRIYTLSSTTPDSDSNSEATLHLQHEISPPLGMIEGARFTSLAGNEIDLIIHGFRGKNFIVWSESTRQELTTVECGGGHRAFDVVFPSSRSGVPGPLRFVFTKASALRFYSQSSPPMRTLKEGGHGRELRAVAASSSLQNGEVGRYIATAAEDTTIRLWQYRDSPSGQGKETERAFKPLAILEKHSAGIQAMKWFGESHLLSSAGNEEFYIWRITQLDSSYESLAVVCESQYPDRSADGDLRIVDFDVEVWGTSDGQPQSDAMLISLALSNSTLRTYVYWIAEKRWVLLAEGRYTGACLTQIRHLRVPGGGGHAGDIQVLTAATDGHIAVWDVSVSDSTDLSAWEGAIRYDCAALFKVHQSSIKGLDVSKPRYNNAKWPGDESWLVVTGGDDNAVQFTSLRYGSASNSYKVLSRSRVKGAHAAGVTGICVVREEKDGKAMEVVSISNDQRVKLWRAVWKEGSEEPVKVTLLDNQYSSVADAGDVEVIKEGRVMVGGVGMEVWDFGA